MTIGHGHYRNKILYAHYGHLGQVFVSAGDRVKRGQLIGLAMELPERFKKFKKFEPHLHFEIFQPKEGYGIFVDRNLLLKTGDPTVFKTFYNPDDFWLGGKAQCFDPNYDYSNHSNIEFTFPIACEKYKRILLKRLGGK